MDIIDSCKSNVVSLKQMVLSKVIRKLYIWLHFVIPACPESFRASRKDSRRALLAGIGMSLSLRKEHENNRLFSSCPRL